jgi:hypothetical protein
LKLSKKEIGALLELVDHATTLTGTFFRSVDYRYMDTKTVLDGGGTLLRGGRFAPTGLRATYLSDSDATASSEVTERKRRLGGDALITLDKYPRIVFGVIITLERHLDFTQPFPERILESLRARSLHPTRLVASQKIGALFAGRGVQAIRFPSVSSHASGDNLAIYVDNCPSAALDIVNAAHYQTTIRTIRTKKR